MQDLTAKLQWWTSEAIADTTSDVFAVTAGLGAGKTHGICQWLYDRTARNSDSQFSALLMPTYSKVHDAAIPTMRRVLHSLGLIESIHYKIILSPFPKVRYTTGQELHFISADNPDRLIAVEYSHGAMDECGSSKMEAAQLLRSRIRCPKAKIRQAFFGGAPQGLNWFAEWFDSDENEGWDKSMARDHRLERKSKETKSTSFHRRFRLTTFDNPYLDRSYIQQLFDTFGHNKNLIQAYVYGYFVPLVTGNAYAEYMPQVHDCDYIAPSPHRPIHLTWDFNANPLTWVAIQQHRFENYEMRKRELKRIAYAEADQGFSQLADACAEFAAKHPREQFANTPIYIYGDSSGHARSHKISRTDYGQIKLYLKQLGFNCVQVRALRHNPLETLSVECLNQWFRENEILICRDLTLLRRSLTATRWADGQKKLEKKKGETHTHPGDALKYYAYAEQRSQGIIKTNLVN